MRILVKVLSTITIIFIFAMMSWFVFYENQPDVVEWEIPTFNLEADVETGTLTVTDTNLNLNWDEITVERGKANLPSGKVNPGDTITNCYGNIELYIKGNALLGSWEFNEEPGEIEEIRFLGNWEGSDRNVHFSLDSYTNSFVESDSDDSTDGDKLKDDGEPASPSLAIQTDGTYDAQVKKIVVQDESFDFTPVVYNVSFFNQDTIMKIEDPSQGFSWEFRRNFTTSLYVEILNASKKLDECLKSFVKNITNQTYNSTLRLGINVSIKFEYELTDEKIYNITQEGLVFNYNSYGAVVYNELNYSIEVDCLHDLYYLASRSDVKKITADDSKFLDFGCI